jgi:metal-responsive CopG/Arc/MetJ family transcriptional regulator
MTDETKSERITILLSPSDLKEVDDWSFEQRIRSRGEAIRRLIELGLKAAKAAATGSPAKPAGKKLKG